MLEEVLEFLIAMPERQVVLNGQAGTCIHLSDHTITDLYPCRKCSEEYNSCLRNVYCHTMTKINSIIFSVIIVLGLILINIRLSSGSELIIKRPRANLTHVPKDLPLTTTTLDLSQNNISELQTSDILSLSKLRALVMSYNSLRYLDIGVFKFNTELEYLDLSHNELRVISCHPTANFKHLDLSFNPFDALPICKEFGNMSQLKFLGLSGSQVQSASVQPIAHLNITEVLLVLGDTYGEREDPECLQHINTGALHVVFPEKREFRFTLDVSVSNVNSLELSNIKCGPESSNCSYFLSALLKLRENQGLSSLTLNNIETTWNSFLDILQSVWHAPVKYFSISNMALQGQVEFRNFNYSGTSLKALSIHQVVSEVYSLPQKYIYGIFSNMNIQNFTVSGTRMLHMLCPLKVSPFLYLDFTDNLLTDMVFEDCRNLIKLKILSLQKNQLKKLENIILMSAEMKSLQKLDISQNFLQYSEEENLCSWTESLLALNLSSNMLTGSVFRCLPPKVKVLDLHNNRITSIPKEITYLQALQELNVASNSLVDLPGCGAFGSLSVLVIEHNSVSHPSVDFFQSCQKIRSLAAGNNPFRCTCELREFITNIGHVSGGVVEGWPDSYRCDSPEGAKGTPLQDFHMSPLSCDTVLLIVTVGATLLVLAAIVAFLWLYFDLLWYLRMMCQWTQTRHRARNVPEEELQRKLQFHAFVSYSGHDSTWVKNELLPNLEKDGIRVCLHERNFIPGKSIMENIIHSIEKSYKSIFVLSPHFIQSEWCHYELYFAHHNLFHEGSDNLILILLEPIPQYSIPSNYHKLKSLMAQRTYLEWPMENSKHRLFWANLRATINVKLVSQAETTCHIQR
ncbi:toll-like receptor 1 isoform X2 [Microtus pennsylvanicus]|uniref:toll-like receptor 1 isoform X2 n=1 Tax=Microtus pennsylvanicus TaxID=10058 RepID=UPI003F6B3013